MTNMPNNPDRDPERDSEMSARWHEHSTELPPPPLDAAILAAAHRAVDSRPTDSAPQDVDRATLKISRPVRAATGPQRWWMPLAAAATIGVVAIGVLQTAPHEQPDMAPSVSDARPAPAPSLIPPRDMYSLEPQTPPPMPAAAAMEKALAMQRKDAPLLERGAAAAPASPASPIPRAEADAAPPSTSTGKLAESAVAESATPRAQSPVAAMTNVAPEPFPADRKKEAADTMTALTPRAPSAPAPATDTAGQRGNAIQDQPARSAIPQSAPAAPGVQAASSATTLSKSRASAEFGAMKVADVDVTIARIRKLHDDGKLADAAKELIALRTTVPDVDARLPLEMRAWAATVKP